MSKIEDLDPATPFMSQLEEKTGPIVLVNTFFVPKTNVAEFLDHWRDDSAFHEELPWLHLCAVA